MVKNNSANDTLFHTTDWSTSLDLEWSISDHKCIVEVNQEFLKLTQSKVDQTLVLTKRGFENFRLNEPYALEIDLRIHSIGYVDNSTDADSQLSFSIGDGIAIGAKFTLLGDRYSVDTDEDNLQYTIFRSLDEQWHHWRFEINPQKQLVRMFRDGNYYYMHKLHAVRQSGFSFQLTGTESVPTTIDFGGIKLEPLNDSSDRDTLIPPALVDLIADGEWPSFRRNRSNTALSPLKGTFGNRNPEVAWQYPLGGWESKVFTADITGDNTVDIIIINPGSISVSTLQGTNIWNRSFDHPVFFGVYDLDENGNQELAILNGSPAHIEILDALTGETRFICEYDPSFDVVGFHIAKLDPDRKGLQLLSWSQHEIGYCLSFENGVENAQVIYTYDYEHFNFVPEIVIADMDNDGLLDFGLATYSHFFIYDGRTGKIKTSLEYPTGRNYGLLIAKDIDNDGFLDLIMLAEQLREHVCVLKNNQGKSLEMLWDNFYEQDYPVDLKHLRTLPGSVCDWDNDGDIEILYGLCDETEDGQWHTLIVEAVTGKVKYELANHYPVTLDRTDSNEPIVILQEVTEKRKNILKSGGPVGHKAPDIVGNLKFVSFSSGKITILGTIPQGQILLDNDYLDFPDNEWAIYREHRHPLREKGATGYYTIIEDSDNSKSISYWDWNSQDSLEEYENFSIPLNLVTGVIVGIEKSKFGKVFLYGALNATLFLFNSTGDILSSFPAGGIIGRPVVGEFNHMKQILVPDKTGDILSLRVNNNSPKLNWRHGSIWDNNFAYVAQGKSTPVIFDWNQDGEKEILFGKHPKNLAMVDSSGEMLWEIELPGKPGFWNYGNFTGQDHFDIFVTFSDGFYGGGCAVLSPDKNSFPVWRSEIGAYASAIGDLDGDGKDEIVLRDLFWRHSLDGSTGQDFWPVRQWAGYHLPMLVDHPEMNNGIKVVYCGGVYSATAEDNNGEQEWWLPMMSRWNPATLADINGDGRLEIGVVTWGQVFNWPAPFDMVPGFGRGLVCLDVGTGDHLWTYDPGTSMSGVSAADINNDGKPEFLIGTGDGRLIAIRDNNNKPEEVFNVQLPGSLGSPIICSLEDNQQLTILVGCADGNLYALE